MTRYPNTSENVRTPSRRRRLWGVVTAAVVMIATALGSVGLSAPPSHAADLDSDVNTIIGRLQDYYLSQGDEVQIANGIYLAQTSEALDYVASQNPDGSWSDVNYQDTTSSANGKTWDAYKALYRMVAIAQAYQDKDAPGYHDASLVTAEEHALTYWDQVNPGNTNWWETEIGESIAMGRISIFLGDVLSGDTAALAIKHNQGKLDPAGANGAWRTSDYLYRAIATRNADQIRAGFATMVKTVAVDDSGTVQEAVQPDASFWAHGAQLYSEGYGMALFTTVAMWADAARGTSLAFTRDQLDTIAFYIIDGTRWMIRGEIGMLYLLYRPATTVDGITTYSDVFLDPLDRMARTDPLYATAYRQLADNIRGTASGNGVTGDKYFWRSEFSSHLRDDYGIFTSLNSSRTVGSEYRSTLRKDVGNEIVWSKAGATAIQVTGKEYTALGPSFDWYHYPGTTAPYVKETTLGPDGRSSNGGSFTGGVSDGTYGASVESLDRANTQAQKSYFSFDDEMVALGAGIRSTSTAEVDTTVNQVAAMGNASVDGKAVAAGTDSQTVANPSWAYNDKVGYVFPGDSPVTVSDKPQTGSYYGGQPETHNAFTLYFDHGVNPTNAGYEYIVLPAATAKQTAAYAAKPAVKILQNTTSVQAVRDAGSKVTMATFYQAGKLGLGDGRTLSVSQPSIVILNESSGTPVVSVSNPSQPGLLVDVALTGPGSAAGATFVLGSGAELGKTVTEPLAVEGAVDSPYAASGSASSHGPALAGDGDASTTWQSTGESPWLSERLAAGSVAAGIDIDWGDAYPARYLIQTSSDGTDWTDQKLVQNVTGGHQHVGFPATPANFVRILLVDDPGSGGFSVREFAADASVNLALGAPTTASDGTGPGSATDGNMTTRWIADRTGSPDTSWLQVDLGSVRAIGTVRISWEASYASQYKIQVSDDGTSWRDAYATPAAGSDGGTDLVKVDATGRYLRVQTVKRALSAYGVSIWELEVYGDDLVANAPAASARVNLALNQPTTADSVYNNLSNIVPTMATDGSTSTKWSSARPTGAAPYSTQNWLRVDLGAVKPVSQAVVEWETGNSTDYQIQGSVDGQQWTQLAHVQNTGTADHRRDVVDFATASVRYVRVIGAPATKYGLNIWEFEVYGGYSLTCPATVAAPPNSAATVTAKISPADSGDTFAAHVLDSTVATITGGPRVGSDGSVAYDLKTGKSGSTSVLVTHGNGDEYAWCPIVIPVDTSALQQLVDQANGFDSTRFTPASWAPLLPALESAKDALKATTPTQTAIDAAAAKLRSAIGGLAMPSAPDAPAWDASTVYHAGDQVSFAGSTWLASWYTQNQKPGDPNGPWQETLVTPGGTAVWTASRIFQAGDTAVYQGREYLAKWYTRNQAPGDPNGPWKAAS
ncbi:polysaccharide lyase family 8 super-sandwich domain-containing protein [Gryllotalpicola koreensis]|uniref:F5/8 type C domain-containing protein n=1 Tax=Gryllotalpicola koreensis TaxID=993086 RepID=A0ABP7ZTR5_9MICO